MRMGDLTADIDLPELIGMLPCSKYSVPHKEQRAHMWNAFDAGADGYLSLAEVDSGFRGLLGVKGKKTADALAPAISRAFHAAKDTFSEGKAAQYVTRCE